MQWENLTSTDIARAVRETGVCIIALGVMEKHSEHLLLGTDFLFGHRLACLAAEKEPAVVFPPLRPIRLCPRWSASFSVALSL